MDGWMDGMKSIHGQRDNFYLLYIYWDQLQNKLSNRNDLLQTTRNKIRRSEIYRMTNPKLHEKLFTCDKYRESRYKRLKILDSDSL